MSKAYKIPTIYSLLSNDSISNKVSLHKIGQSLMDFYVNVPLHQKDIRGLDWHEWDLTKFIKKAKEQPVGHLNNNSTFSSYDQINKELYLDDSLNKYLSSTLAKHVRDILEYRTIHHFRRRFREDDD